ncbi:amidohydrolase [Acidaminobacter sp. JC074]|uniref:amidohydrolase family protein n=1 Tax=Acidaminobacter sp. JC074 TaxID=2530199 RepID=UPI001F1177BE|nr:amidohydrolase family protein [Acidaminobacter sp. JC074]MCH4890172.1 amidohydrolase [Acidaminobacter sp. JC074]
MYDLVIKDGIVIDPERGIRTIASIGITNGIIKRITREDIEGKSIIDAGGLIVSPGFIDIHTHVDAKEDLGKCMAIQGVTSVVSGNCGLNTYPVDKFYKTFEKGGLVVNEAMLIGHTFELRSQVGITDIFEPASKEQINEMVKLCEDAFKAGAFGLSFGIEYQPGSSFDEMLELAKVSAKYGRMIAVHTRHDAFRAVEGIHEALKLAELTGASLQFAHLEHTFGVGLMTEVLDSLKRARKKGYDVWADSGLYSAFATLTSAPCFDDGCAEKFGVDYSDFVIATGTYAGSRCTRELLKQVRKEEPNSFTIGFTNRDSDAVEAIKEPFVMLSSDIIPSENPDEGHPQATGTVPKLFRWISREMGLLTTLEAINKAAFLPAERLGLTNKGRIKVGADADIVIFNERTIRDTSDYSIYGNPKEKPQGISAVIIDGKIVVKDNEFINLKAGKALRKPLEYYEL